MEATVTVGTVVIFGVTVIKGVVVVLGVVVLVVVLVMLVVRRVVIQAQAEAPYEDKVAKTSLLCFAVAGSRFILFAACVTVVVTVATSQVNMYPIRDVYKIQEQL